MSYSTDRGLLVFAWLILVSKFRQVTSFVIRSLQSSQLAHHHPVPPLALATVHRPVGAAQGLLEAGPAEGRDAEGDGDAEGRVLGAEGVGGHRRADALGGDRGVVVAEVVEGDDELLAAPAPAEVDVPDARGEEAGYAAEDAVALVVSAAVVDELEVVHVEYRHMRWLLAIAVQCVEGRLHAPAVAEPREGIGFRELRELDVALPGRFALRCDPVDGSREPEEYDAEADDEEEDDASEHDEGPQDVGLRPLAVALAVLCHEYPADDPAARVPHHHARAQVRGEGAVRAECFECLAAPRCALALRRLDDLADDVAPCVPAQDFLVRQAKEEEQFCPRSEVG